MESSDVGFGQAQGSGASVGPQSPVGEYGDLGASDEASVAKSQRSKRQTTRTDFYTPGTTPKSATRINRQIDNPGQYMKAEGSRGYLGNRLSNKYANDDKQALSALTALEKVEIHKPSGAELYVGDISDADVAELLSSLPPSVCDYNKYCRDENTKLETVVSKKKFTFISKALSLMPGTEERPRAKGVTGICTRS